jgi:quercetin dioxygenase-like cupin family protein
MTKTGLFTKPSNLKGGEGIMKVITIEELPGVVPEAHYDLLSYRIVDEKIGAKSMGASLGRMEPSGRTGPHAHEKAEQLFIILKGEMLMKTDRGEARLKQGQAAFIYPGEVHENYNVANGTTEYLVVTSRLST